jgi:chlorobactene glucosyltransferase
MNFLAYYFIATAAYLALVWWDNARLCFQRVPPFDPARKKWPLVSICVPARNEEKRIGPLLESLSKINYPRYEILIMDDQSTDGTWKLLQRYAKKSSRFRLFKGTTPPTGWVGKPWACHQLSQKAGGDWLLFTDADTWHEPDVLKRVVQAAEEKSSDLLSTMTGQATKTWLEYLVIPVMCYDLISFFPKRWVLKQGHPLSQVAWANGQFLFFRKKAYRAIGGHTAVKDRIDEDLTFAKITVRENLRLTLFNGSDLSGCRMYTSAMDVWMGFSKIIFPSLEYSVIRALIAYALVLIIAALPFVLLFTSTPGTLLFNAALSLAAVQVLVRLDQAFRFRFPLFSCFLHPLANVLFILIGFNSVRWYLFARQGHWKGRVVKVQAAA